MLILALVLAGFLLAFAAFSAFGLPYMIMGARAFEEFGDRPDAQALAGMLASAALLVAALPFVAPALISEGPQVQVVAETVTGATFPSWS